jgi:hypothetical protein
MSKTPWDRGCFTCVRIGSVCRHGSSCRILGTKLCAEALASADAGDGLRPAYQIPSIRLHSRSALLACGSLLAEMIICSPNGAQRDVPNERRA